MLLGAGACGALPRPRDSQDGRPRAIRTVRLPDIVLLFKKPPKRCLLGARECCGLEREGAAHDKLSNLRSGERAGLGGQDEASEERLLLPMQPVKGHGLQLLLFLKDAARVRVFALLALLACRTLCGVRACLPYALLLVGHSQQSRCTHKQ